MADADSELKEGIRAMRATLRSVHGLERQIADIDAAPADEREARADERARLSAELRAARRGLGGRFDRLVDLASLVVGTTVPSDVPRDGPVFAALPVPKAWDVVSGLESLMEMKRTVAEVVDRLRAMERDERDEPFTGNFARLLAPFGIHTGRQLVRAAARIAQAVQGCAILITLARVALYPENRSWVAVVYLAFMGAAIRFSRWAMWTTTQ